MKNVDGQTDVGHINLIGRLVTRNPPIKKKTTIIYQTLYVVQKLAIMKEI